MGETRRDHDEMKLLDVAVNWLDHLDGRDPKNAAAVDGFHHQLAKMMTREGSEGMQQIFLDLKLARKEARDPETLMAVSLRLSGEDDANQVCFQNKKEDVLCAYSNGAFATAEKGGSMHLMPPLESKHKK